MSRGGFARVRASALAVAVLAASGAIRPARAQDPVKPLEEQIELSKQRLEAIRAERARLRSEMEALAAQVHNVASELENLDRQARNQEKLLRELDYQLAIRDQQIAEMTADLLRTQDQLVEKKALFARRVRDLYKRGPLASVQVLLAAESFSDLINRYQYLYLVALHDRLLVRQIEELKEQLESQHEKLRREIRGLQELRDEKVRELQDLYFLEQQRTRRLKEVRGLQKTAESRLKELRRDESELTNLIARLEREREAAEALASSGPRPGTLTPEERGRLDWPVEGPVIYGFGRQRNKDGTAILRQGIGIAAPEGAPVKAIAGGTVFFARPFLGYGPSVILSHGGGDYSLYLYLSEILVSEGENVILGQTIGRVGGAETPEGPHIEFQIRIDSRAVDPLPWLKKRRG
jgi:septal ring factor EnvC (AmiA/AmiB activator)